MTKMWRCVCWPPLAMVVLLLAGCTHGVMREHHTSLGPIEAQETWLGKLVAQAPALSKL